MGYKLDITLQFPEYAHEYNHPRDTLVYVQESESQLFALLPCHCLIVASA